MTNEVAALQQRINKAIDTISNGFEVVGSKLSQQKEINTSLSKEIDKNITELAKIIDVYQEQ